LINKLLNIRFLQPLFKDLYPISFPRIFLSFTSVRLIQRILSYWADKISFSLEIKKGSATPKKKDRLTQPVLLLKNQTYKEKQKIIS